jgi:hypothetical protein
MEAPLLERKPVAIVAADVEGYSSLMSIDEEGMFGNTFGQSCHDRRACCAAWRSDMRHSRRHTTLFTIGRLYLEENIKEARLDTDTGA